MVLEDPLFNKNALVTKFPEYSKQSNPNTMDKAQLSSIALLIEMSHTDYLASQTEKSWTPHQAQF